MTMGERGVSQLISVDRAALPSCGRPPEPARSPDEHRPRTAAMIRPGMAALFQMVQTEKKMRRAIAFNEILQDGIYLGHLDNRTMR